MVLDHERLISLDPADPDMGHWFAIGSYRPALKHLAHMVRAQEQTDIDERGEPFGGRLTVLDYWDRHPVVYAAFNWFSISLTNYLRLVAIVELLTVKQWALRDLVDNAGEVKRHCKSYVSDIVPAVALWRDKVAAHPSITDPVPDGSRKRERDMLGTLVQSLSCPVSNTAGYLEVGPARWKIDGEESVVLPWSVTATYERLTPRFWPDAPIEPHKYPDGLGPGGGPGTYLDAIRARG